MTLRRRGSLARCHRGLNKCWKSSQLMTVLMYIKQSSRCRGTGYSFFASRTFLSCNLANSPGMARHTPSDEIMTEKGYSSSDRLERLRTQGGHIASTDQPSLPVVHRRLANPAPLGLLSFATGIFLISVLGVHARGIQTPNVLVGVLMFFGGICQFIAGIMEFIAGNTFGATVFPSYAAFNFSYAMIFIPGTGIIDCKFNIPRIRPRTVSKPL
jgi:hypothetical protein